MKKLVVLLLSALSLTACNSDELNQNEIKLSHTEISLVRGESQLIWINGGEGEYSVTCDDTEIAFVQIYMSEIGPAVLVRACEVGSTRIVVSDGSKKIVPIDLTVTNGDVRLITSSLALTLNSINRVPIIGGSLKFEAEIDDPEVAEVRVEQKDGEYLVLIESKKIGQAVVTVTDTEDGKQAFLAVSVKKFGLHIVETRIAVDAEKKEAIEKELNENPPFPLNSTLVMEEDRYAIFAPDETEIVHGTYSMKQESVLSLYGIRVEEQILYKFRFDAVTEGREHHYYVFYVSSGLFYFCEDLTSEYKARFPDAGVNRVGRALVFKHGWIED